MGKKFHKAKEQMKTWEKIYPMKEQISWSLIYKELLQINKMNSPF